MTKQNNSAQNPGRISRRQFMKLAAATGLLAGCSPAAQPVAAPTQAPTPTPKPAPVPAVTQPNTPKVVSAVTGKPDIIKLYPEIPSRLVQVHHAGVWDGDRLLPEAVRQMLDASITKLTGLNDAREAWAALFKPGEKIAIKVNTFSNSTIWTHAPLTNAVIASLQEAGLSAGQIVIYDYLSMLKDAGYQVNQDGPGVRCLEESEFSGQWKVADSTVRLSGTLQNCDALINIPVLKSHMIAGLTFALKNHFGSVNSPGSLHYPIEQTIAELNALPPIKERTRLVIGDVLEANLKYSSSWPYWKPDWKGDSILMSFDPVALDAAGMQILEQLQTENEASLSSALRDKATSYLKTAAELGLGTNDPQHIDKLEVRLG
ncbi:MAG: DUF362 domain-containing protein [Anaerolineae bacterium]|nr:DUF362 domain-containing protein [Anaerolineae bacterium]